MGATVSRLLFAGRRIGAKVAIVVAAACVAAVWRTMRRRYPAQLGSHAWGLADEGQPRPPQRESRGRRWGQRVRLPGRRREDTSDNRLQKRVAGVLHGGGEEAEAALEAMLERGLEALEALSSATPRRKRKDVDAVCERVEEALQGVGEVARRVAGAEEAALALLSEHLCLMGSLSVEDGSAESVTTVTATLDELLQYSDPVAGAVRSLEAAGSGVRRRGLASLASLERVALEAVVDAEVGAAQAVRFSMAGVVCVMLSQRAGGDNIGVDIGRCVCCESRVCVCARCWRVGRCGGSDADGGTVLHWWSFPWLGAWTEVCRPGAR
jgi:hypothetical protein